VLLDSIGASMVLSWRTIITPRLAATRSRVTALMACTANPRSLLSVCLTT
jgi:hypothetical protein